VALTLDIGLNTVLSRAAYAQAELATQTADLSLKNTERAAVLEIRNAVRTVQTAFKQVQAYKIARDLAEKKLAAEEEKLRLGLSTNYTVLQYQRDLTTAQVQELKSVIDYNIALADLDRSMGTLLENRNIRIADALGGRSY
ncbi:MAG: TolC family protein, partial [Acidobacteria bacterium]|nr:TolC family protein [Acidobacteriota bacterium]